MITVDVAVPATAKIGECPLWSPEGEYLYWIDIEGRAVHRFEPSTGTNETVDVPGRPGSIARTPTDSGLLMSMEADLVWLDWTTGTVSEWITVSTVGEDLRFNDGRTDPMGRFWVGSMDERFNSGRAVGELYRIDRDGSVTTHKGDLAIPNGLAFDETRSRMYFADTVCEAVWSYDYNNDTGAMSNEQIFVDFAGLSGRPDGACIDVDGGYWVAAASGWAVMRFTPDGVLDRTIELPVQTPTMPAFGGANLDTLFVTTMGSAFATAPGQSHAGSVLAIDAGTSGRSDVPFGAA